MYFLSLTGYPSTVTCKEMLPAVTARPKALRSLIERASRSLEQPSLYVITPPAVLGLCPAIVELRAACPP